ncbi:MAG: DUF2070 family protein [Nitrosopumilaceae archaeon]|nr:DUF2070 family protein [Nitrosopumilaceae archaeon]
MDTHDRPDGKDGVSVIHGRFSLTLLNPSSHYFSLAASLGIAAAIPAIIHMFYLPDSGNIVAAVFASVAVLFLTQLLDTRFTRKKEYSKSLHSSLFANLLWLASLLAGLAAGLVLAKEMTPFFVTLGMFLFASFRIGIYTTTLGTSLRRAWAIAMVQPLAMLLVIVPYDAWADALGDPLALGYGVSFMIIATAWSHLTNVAGRPGMESTHKTIQAYLASQGGDYEDAEKIMEQRSSEARVSTAQIRLSSKDSGDKFHIVLPDIHPGPYHPVGGSNIPYLIYKNLDSSAMVMHSVSHHALNLPSRAEVANYLRTIEECSVTEEGLRCTEPVTVTINRARVMCILFGRRPILFLSLSPHGMEDVPSYVKTEIVQYAENRDYSGAMIVDCHNAMGPTISEDDGRDMLEAAKSCLDNLVAKDTHPIEFGYANSDAMDIRADDMGLGGLGVACLRINGRKFHIGWADANNMENGVREKIIEHLASKGYEMLEICTSDTHFSRVKVRNRNGYYHLGLVTPAERLSGWFEELASAAERDTSAASYEILENEAVIRVMGSSIFDDYSKALENSLRITKYFALGGAALFVTGLFL